MRNTLRNVYAGALPDYATVGKDPNKDYNKEQVFRCLVDILAQLRVVAAENHLTQKEFDVAAECSGGLYDSYVAYPDQSLQPLVDRNDISGKEIVKVTHGFVTQRWDAVSLAFLGQSFTPGDIVDYENEKGEPSDDEEPEYRTFDMVEYPPVGFTA